MRLNYHFLFMPCGSSYGPHPGKRWIHISCNRFDGPTVTLYLSINHVFLEVTSVPGLLAPGSANAHLRWFSVLFDFCYFHGPCYR